MTGRRRNLNLPEIGAVKHARDFRARRAAQLEELKRLKEIRLSIRKLLQTAISELEKGDKRKVLQILQHGLGLFALDNQTYQPGPAGPPIVLPMYLTPGVDQVSHQTPHSSRFAGPTSSNSAPTTQNNVLLNEQESYDRLVEQLFQIYLDMEK